MIADAHFKLSQAVRTKVDDSDIEFEDSFRYETSTKNVRIEAWWAQMSKFQTYRWKVCESLNIFLTEHICRTKDML